MLSNILRFGAALAVCAIGMSPGGAAAQSSGSGATALEIALTGATPSVIARAASNGGDLVEASADRVRDGRAISGLATAMTVGSATGPGVVSVASISDLDLLNGLVTATSVVAVATNAAGGLDATGSTIEGLAIRGVPVAGLGAIAPNTRLDIPGFGYAVLNEQVREAGALTVTMIRLVQLSPTGTPRGEIVVARARSGS